MFSLFIFCVIIAGAIGFTKTPYFKGVLGEYKVNSILSSRLNNHKYTILKDILLPSGEGTTQIDHVVISEYGIFVIETKNYNHWIFGSEKSPTWRQQRFKAKYNFQNPLHQNFKHLKTIQELTGVEINKIFNVVVFAGRCEFKTEMPPSVVKLFKLIGLITSHTDKILDKVDAKIENSFLNKLMHIESIRINREDKNKRLGSNENRRTITEQIFYLVKAQAIFKLCVGHILAIIFLFSLPKLFELAIHSYFNNLTITQKNINKSIPKDSTQKNSAINNIILNNSSLPTSTPTYSPQNTQINFQQSKPQQPERQSGRQVMYSWTNEDGHKTFSNKGFPEDGKYTNGKMERY